MPQIAGRETGRQGSSEPFVSSVSSMEAAGTADSAGSRRQRRLRVALELGYLGLCTGLALFGLDSGWYYPTVILTLPWGAMIWFVSAIAYGGLLADLSEAQAEALVTLAFMVAALLNVAVARRLIPTRRVARAQL
jgi:hypothetical protein